LLNEKRIFRLDYYCEARTSGNALKWHIVSAGLWLDYLQASLFVSEYQTAVGIISPLEIANKASHLQNKLWKNHDLTVQPVITYTYLCGRIYASRFILYLYLFVWATLCIPFYLIFQTVFL
jgi:hypothetical protein